MTGFLDVIDQLTKPHPVTLRRDAGTTIHTQDGLLLQLREAVFSGMEGGSGSQFGSKPPIDPAAVDLLEEITTQAAEALAQVTGKPVPYGHAEHYVRLWAAQVDDNDVMIVTTAETIELPPGDLRPAVFRERHEYTAVQLVRHWQARVEAFFNPPKDAEIMAPCPQCGERYVYRRKDGVTVQSSALVFIRDRETGDTSEARCQECGASWGPALFIRLGELIAAAAQTAAIRHAEHVNVEQDAQLA